MKREKTAHVARVHERYSEIVEDVSKDLGQLVWGGNDLGSLERWVNMFMKMIENKSEEQ